MDLIILLKNKNNMRIQVASLIGLFYVNLKLNIDELDKSGITGNK